MSVRAPALAKLTRPKLYEAVARPRLFSLLDDAAKRPIVWICAPPGAGKTTLVASYLEQRGLRHIWYQVDVGDADPATFVHYMRVAALQIGRKHAVLPLFPPEPQQDLSRFARSFLRDLFGQLSLPCAIVLDNFQDARPTPEHRAALAQGLEEIPDGVTVFVISRTDPPPEFARLAANRCIGRIDEAALRCTPGEAIAILGRPTLDEGIVRRILRQSNGWVAALVLLREHLSHRGASLDESLGEGKDAIFQYFAGEIFNRAQPENQRMLMLTAIAPSFTNAEAVALTGNEEAPRLLEYLYRRHLFVDRRRGTQTTYQYHALFREYLREEMARRVPRDVQRAATVRAAALLAERGLAVEALELYCEAGEWEAMRAVINAHALDWARQGRRQVLSDWIEALPATLRAADPWLDYWFGRAWVFVQPDRGRPALEHAFAAFRATDDLRGQALALSTIVTSYYYEWADFRPLDRWLPELDRILQEGQRVGLDASSELRARAAQLAVVLLRRPDEDVLRRCASQLDPLVAAEPDLNVRVMAASILLNTYNWIKSGDEASALVARIQPVIAEGEVAPLMQLWWRTQLAAWHYFARRYDDANAVTVEAREIAERYGFEAFLFEIDHGQASALISKGEFAAAKALVDAMERRLAPSRRMDRVYLHYLRSMLAQRLGQGAVAVQEAERAVALGRDAGLPSLQVPHFLMRLAHSRGVAGDRTGCAQAMDAAIALATGADRANFERQRELLQIEVDLDAGRTRLAAQRLSAVMTACRQRGQVVFLRHRPDVAAKLINFALANAIEPDFARELIERNALAPPHEAGSAWPFRLRVRVLGRFELLRDQQVMRSSGKAQQRPLDLLKFVVALGGHDVDGQQAMAVLWPDADGAAAKTSFDATLFRLRRLLGVDQAIILAGGKLSLSTAIVWTDVREFEAAIEAAQRACVAIGSSLSSAVARLIEAYPGALLGNDEAAWIAKPRDTLHARFVRAVMRLGECLEHRGDWLGAIDLYRRGLEVDNLCETFYRGLMRSLVAIGDHSGALTTYRRCRDLLSIVLSVKPSSETERLHRQIASRATSTSHS